MAKKGPVQIVKMNESHDWLGEAAENYVRYLFACEGFQVFAGSKWGADLAIHRPGNTKRWWRIEVRSTDRNKRPLKKRKERLKQIADFVVEVNLKAGLEKCTHSLKAVIYPVKKDGGYGKSDDIYIDDEERRVFFGKKDERAFTYLNRHCKK